jgi:hypothetical protein
MQALEVRLDLFHLVGREKLANDDIAVAVKIGLEGLEVNLG